MPFLKMLLRRFQQFSLGILLRVSLPQNPGVPGSNPTGAMNIILFIFTIVQDETHKNISGKPHIFQHMKMNYYRLLTYLLE